MRRRLYPLVVAAGLAVGSLVPATGALGASANGTARRQLNTSLPEVKLEGVAFSDALDFLRDISGINMTVNWKALEAAGITKEAPVTLRLRAISLRKALQMVLTEAGGGSDTLAYDIDEGVVEITTKEQADSRMITKVYPIEDLIMDIPDFTDAPEFDLASITNQQNQNGGGGGVGGGGGYSGGGGSSQQGLFGGSGGGGGQGNNREAPGKTKTERANDLIDLIRSIVQPDIWQENGGKAAIRYWQGNLIITAPRSVHEAIGGPVD